MKKIIKIVVIVVIIIALIFVGICLKILFEPNSNTTEIEFEFKSGKTVLITFTVGDSMEVVFNKLQSNGVEYEPTDTVPSFSNVGGLAIKTDWYDGVYYFIFREDKLSYIILQNGDGIGQKLPVYKGGFS